MLLEQETLLWASVDNRQDLDPCLHLGNLGRSGRVKAASIVRDMVRAWLCCIWTVAKQGHNPPFLSLRGAKSRSSLLPPLRITPHRLVGQIPTSISAKFLQEIQTNADTLPLAHAAQ